MAIPLGQARNSSPVLKRRALGEVFRGAIFDLTQREARTIDGEARLNRKGTQATELLVSCLVMPPTTMIAGIGGREAVPEEGSEVRAIFTSGGLSQWIEAAKALDRQPNVGDVLTLTTSYVEVYDVRTKTKVRQLTTAEDIAQHPESRAETHAYRGEVLVRPANADEVVWVARAEQAYHRNHAPNAIALQQQESAGAVAAGDLLP